MQVNYCTLQLLVEDMAGSERAGTKELKTHPRPGIYEFFISQLLPPVLIMNNQLLHLVSKASSVDKRRDSDIIIGFL